jgi:hypothetical protein
MLINKRLVATTALAFSACGVAQANKGNACPHLAMKDAADAEMALYEDAINSGDCSAIEKFLVAARKQNQAVDAAIANCTGVERTRGRTISDAEARELAMQICTSAAAEKGRSKSDQ